MEFANTDCCFEPEAIQVSYPKILKEANGSAAECDTVFMSKSIVVGTKEPSASPRLRKSEVKVDKN
jgi:hypothetical protein